MMWYQVGQRREVPVLPWVLSKSKIPTGAVNVAFSLKLTVSPSAFIEILHSSVVLMFIYYRYKSVVGRVYELADTTPPC
jgi:hypothetical protein